jgi:sodium/hydrogen antiporter
MEKYKPQEWIINQDGSFFEYDPFMLFFIYVGIIILVAGILPRILEKRLITAPIIYLIIGVLIFLIPLDFHSPDFIEEPYLAKRLTEIGVIISLTGVGLKLNAPFSKETWKISKRLLILTMPLTIFLFAAMGYWILGFLPATTLLLGAVLAPTDPVLASEIQTTSPNKKDYSRTRLALTTEAGLNDGLAFPFTNMAIAMVLVGNAPSNWIQGWLVMDFFYKIIVGAIIGYAVGWLLGKIIFRFLVKEKKINSITTGTLVVSLTFLPYGLAEMASSYGFIAVFVAACIFRSMEASRRYLDLLHDFSEELERLFIALLFVFIGPYLVLHFPEDFEWYMIPASLCGIFMIRPLAGMLGLLGTSLSNREKWVISFFGIRGIGTLYYFFYALYLTDFTREEEVLALVMVTIILSLVIHGVLAKPAMAWIKSKEKSKPDTR